MSLLALRRSFEIDDFRWIELRPQFLVPCGDTGHSPLSPLTRMLRQIEKFESIICRASTSLMWIQHRSLMAGKWMMMATLA